MSDATVFCNQCGQPVNAAASFCTRCGGALTPAVPGATIAAPGLAAPVPPGLVGQQFAGFWIRFVAHLIDSIVLNVIFVPIAFVLFGGYFATHHLDQDQPPDAGFFVLLALFTIVASLSVWLYEAVMTSSSKQGTLGKMALHLRVTDMNGARISFGRSTGRFLAKIFLSGIMAVGFIMAGFTPRKQSLHDILASTLVLRG